MSAGNYIPALDHTDFNATVLRFTLAAGNLLFFFFFGAVSAECFSGNPHRGNAADQGTNDNCRYTERTKVIRAGPTIGVRLEA